MEVRRRQKYPTATQKQKLIEFIKKHPELISCKVKQGFTYRDSQRLWQVIANECNAVPLGARKSWRQWKKTWQDMRTKRKKRQAEANGELLENTALLTSTKQEELDIKDIQPEFQESTEFVSLEDNSQDIYKDQMSGSLSDRDSSVESKILKIRRQKYVTPRQKEILMELIKKHPELNSKDKQGMSKRETQLLWQDIAKECNSVHMGARKSWSQWKKTWQDMRSKMVKRRADRAATNGTLLMSTAALTEGEHDELGLKDMESSELQEAEFVILEDNSQEVFNEELSGSLSDRDSPVERKVFNSETNPRSHGGKHGSKHKCYFNCDLLAAQEQRKVQMKEDYLNFKKDYLRQKLKLLKEQTEALKTIAKELAT